jgi:cellobiose-specific phosphotransferase system component IIC
MSDYPSTPKDYVSASYRYLRLAMVIVVAVLAVSLAIEIAKASCWQGSISEYYYTPVHAVFIGTLVTIGVCLVALKGRDTVEDLFLNLAGVLAPVVALVPTSRPGTICSRSGSELTVSTTALVSNNIPALLVGAGIAIIVAYLIASRQQRIDSAEPKAQLKDALTPANIVGFTISAALLLAGFIWYRASETRFEKYAHGYAAVAMFVAIWGAVMVDSAWPRTLLEPLYKALGENPPDEPPPGGRTLRYRTGYRIISVFMALAALAIVVTRSITWRQRTFWLEALEITPFAVFWILQTLEGWETGPTHHINQPTAA